MAAALLQLLPDAHTHDVFIPNTRPPTAVPQPILLPLSLAEEGKEKERVYAMRTHCSDPSFEVLDLAHPHKWEPLPLPPFASSSYIRSFMAVDGGHAICVSTEYENTGMYCFDTGTLEWCHAGDWVLPFGGHGYVPELGTWLGSSSPGHCFDPSRLCATSKLSEMKDVQPKPKNIWPKLQYVWEDLTPPSEEFLKLGGRFQGTVLTRSMNWLPGGQHLVNLGGGRFCIAKVFKVEQEIRFHLEGDTTVGAEFVVLIGVEVVRDGDVEGGLRMVKHKSKRYVFSTDRIRCVL